MRPDGKLCSYLESNKGRRLLDYLEHEKGHYGEDRDTKICAADHNRYSSIVYRYNIGGNGFIPVVVASAVDAGCQSSDYDEKHSFDYVGTTRNNKPMNPQVKTDFPEVEAETLLILQEVISTEGYGKGETAYFGNEFTRNKSCVREPQLDLMRSGSEGDIFSDIETPSKGNLKNRRNRSFERSITPPNLDGFLDEVYGFDNQDTVGNHEEEITVVENAGEYIDHKVENANHLSTAEYLSKLGKKRGLGRRGLERNKIDYSLFSRQRYNNHQSSSNTKVGDSGKSSFGFEISSSHQPYSECYLEVDGVCYLETHQDEDDEIEREIERERYKKQMKFREGDTEGNYGKHSKRQKNSEKLLNREWKSIQRIMNKDDFRSLDSIGDGI